MLVFEFCFGGGRAAHKSQFTKMINLHKGLAKQWCCWFTLPWLSEAQQCVTVEVLVRIKERIETLEMKAGIKVKVFGCFLRLALEA